MSNVLDGTPYSEILNSDWLKKEHDRLDRRVRDLRSAGKLTSTTLRAHYGDRLYEQIAESNAIEGSPLTVKETELAVSKGITISGHSPGWTSDAVNLAKGLNFANELAGDRRPITTTSLRQLHACILGESPWAGKYREIDVQISGSPHRPPPFLEVGPAMEEWSRWSEGNPGLPPLIRSIVLSTWLTHIHPFRDGNGRTSRAVMNLELIRGGFPIVIIRKKDRQRYYEALAESDSGGDLRPIAELIFTRAGHSLSDLERMAQKHQGYDRVQAALLRRIERRAGIWNDAVRLLFSLVLDALHERVGELGKVEMKWYTPELDVEDYRALCRNDSGGNSWLCRVVVRVPALGESRYLAWTGYRGPSLRKFQRIGRGPSVFWSLPRPDGYPYWVTREDEAPGFVELTIEAPDVDRWIVRSHAGDILRVEPSHAAQRIARSMVDAI